MGFFNLTPWPPLLTRQGEGEGGEYERGLRPLSLRTPAWGGRGTDCFALLAMTERRKVGREEDFCPQMNRQFKDYPLSFFIIRGTTWKRSPTMP